MTKPLALEGKAAKADVGTRAELSVHGKRAHLAYLDHFRAFAILSVVMIHAGNALLLRGLEGFPAESFSPYRTGLHILVHNSTVYFALISGILYAHTLYRKPHGPFLRSRLSNVALPYALVSIALTLAFIGVAVLRGGDSGTLLSVLGTLAYNVLLGEAWNTLWYIPVVMVLYLISPVLITCVRNRRWQAITAVIVLLPLFVSRTGSTVTASMIVYFIGVYTVGIMVGLDLEKSLQLIRKHRAALAFAALLSALGVAILDWRQFEFVGPISVRESVIYILRLSLSGLVLLWMSNAAEQWSDRTKRWSCLLAAYAFGIYFLHGPLLRVIAQVIGSSVPAGEPAIAVILAMAATFLVGLLVSMLLVWIVVRITGRYSKQIIGAAAP